MGSNFLRLLILALLIVGCGSGSDNYVFTGAPSGGSISPPTTVVGRLFLGADIPGATLRIVTLDGQTLGSGTTSRQGLVHFPNLALPSDFQAFATVPGSDIEFSAQLRNFDPSNRQVHISVLSTLASETMRAKPGLSLHQAENVVKQALGLPQDLKLGVSLGEPNPVFSSLAFFKEAAANGGWNEYKNQILALADANNQQASVARHHLFSLDLVQGPINGLEPGLSEIVEAARIETRKRLNLAPTAALNTNLRHAPPNVFLEPPTSLGGQFLFGVAQGITGNVVGDIAGGLLGWASNQLGLHYGTSSQLNEISEQLTSVESSLTQLQSQITDNDIESKVKTLLESFHDVIDLSSSPPTGAHVSLISSIGTTLTAISQGNQVPLNQPVVTNINSLIATLREPDFTSILGDAQTQLTGSTGILIEASQIVLNQKTGIDTPGSLGYFPWRQNRVLDQILPVDKLFSTLQTTTLNIYSETAHNYLEYENPVDGINAITPNVMANIASQKSQRQLLPFRNSVEGITPDLQNGVMWFDQVWDADTYTNAKATADSLAEQVVFPDGTVHTYDDWHLPTYGEFVSLQKRGTYNPNYDKSFPSNSNDDYPDYGQATRGLVGLGFYNVSGALATSPDDNGSNGDLWMSYYELLGAPGTSAGYDIESIDEYEFRLNHEDNNTYKDKHSDDTNAYLVARTFGPKVVVTPFALIGANAPGAVPDGIAGVNFVTGEYAQYGVATAVAVEGSSAATPVTYPVAGGNSETFTPPNGAVEFYAKITYAINVGGTFTVGYGSGKTESITNTSYSYSGDVYTNTAPASGQYNALQQLVNWSVANSDASAVARMNLLNVPYASGIGIPLNSGAVTVTASLLGASAKVISGTYSYDVPASTKTLTGLQITPRNQLYGANGLDPATGEYSYYCTGFFSDGTVESLGGQVTWSVTPETNAANAQIDIVAGVATLKLAQPAQANPVDYQLTITATYQGKSDSTLIEISPPVSPNT